jgi:hypothetical protein
MLERDYQAKLIKRIEELLPGCVILKNDTDYLQGIPDLLILFHDRWAMLEVKRSRTARNQPNQVWYICMLNELSFAAFIYPENEEEVLDALQQALRTPRRARIPERV